MAKRRRNRRAVKRISNTQLHVGDVITSRVRPDLEGEVTGTTEDRVLVRWRTRAGRLEFSELERPESLVLKTAARRRAA